MGKLLITGATESMADVLCNRFATRHSVRLLQSSAFTLRSDAEVIVGDLADAGVIDRAFRDTETVIHVAPTELPSPDSLDAATRGTYLLARAAIQWRVKRIILISSLSVFNRCPSNWSVTPAWAATPRPEDLCIWLTEVTLKETLRGQSILATCLRIGDSLTNQLEAVEEAVGYVPSPDPDYWGIPEPHAGWRVVHAGPRTQPASDDRAWREVLFAPARVQNPIRNVVIFGAGGPVGAAAANVLSSRYVLRLTDARDLADIRRAALVQSANAPLPPALPAPHESQRVDITDFDQVLAACTGMDAIINCAVVRHDLPQAFRVNTLGMYHLMEAAARLGIPRVVQTAPYLFPARGWEGYLDDRSVPADAPARVGGALYFTSKLLSLEIARVYAECTGIVVPALLFADLGTGGSANSTYICSWDDAGNAIRCALESTRMPSSYEVFAISADMPHRRFDIAKAMSYLGWQPEHDFQFLWSQPR
jgi:nucleoside-diphosphate-sugar epimerase